MSNVEIISLAVFGVALIVAVTIMVVWPYKRSSAKTIPKTPTSLLDVETETVKTEPKDDIVTFSVSKEEAKVVEEALDEHRKRKGRLVNTGESETNLSQVDVDSDDFDKSLLVSVEEGITALEQEVLKAARSGDADFVKKAFINLDWLEDLRDRLHSSLENPR